MDPQHILKQPKQASTWFQSHYTGVHTDSGIIRRFGVLQNITDKQRKQCKQFMESASKAFPTLTTDQENSLQAAAVAWGILVKTIDKVTNSALIKLVAAISQMSE